MGAGRIPGTARPKETMRGPRVRRPRKLARAGTTRANTRSNCEDRMTPSRYGTVSCPPVCTPCNKIKLRGQTQDQTQDRLRSWHRARTPGQDTEHMTPGGMSIVVLSRCPVDLSCVPHHAAPVGQPYVMTVTGADITIHRGAYRAVTRSCAQTSAHSTNVPAHSRYLFDLDILIDTRHPHSGSRHA